MLRSLAERRIEMLVRNEDGSQEAVPFDAESGKPGNPRSRATLREEGFPNNKASQSHCHEIVELLGSEPALPRNSSPMEPVVVVTLSRNRLLWLVELEVERLSTWEPAGITLPKV